MTNVDFFRLFADEVIENVKQAYHFEHGRSRRADANLYDGSDTKPIKMFHYTQPGGIIVRKNDSGATIGVEYRGTCYCIKKSNLDELVDKSQIVNNTTNYVGKYDTYVKGLIDGGGIIKEIIDFNACEYDHDLNFTRISEVYNDLDFNGDGIAFEYTLYIEND